MSVLEESIKKKLYTRFPGPSKIGHYAVGLVCTWKTCILFTSLAKVGPSLCMIEQTKGTLVVKIYSTTKET